MKNPFKDPSYQTERQWRLALLWFVIMVILLPLAFFVAIKLVNR